jgi:hypothetical protein
MDVHQRALFFEKSSIRSRSIMNRGNSIRGGDMPEELQAEVDGLLDQFLGLVDSISVDRHLQRGIARSLLPCSIVALLDSKSLFIVAQFRPEGRTSNYLYSPDKAYQQRNVLNAAMVEFGFLDPFLIQFPSEILNESPQQRLAALEKSAADHIDSEFERFVVLLNLLRTRPIFGSSPSSVDSQMIYVLSPEGGPNNDAISNAIKLSGLTPYQSQDIRAGKSEVREMWLSINDARIIVADMTGADPSVMYGLGIAHTVGKDTVLIHPEGSQYLVDIPRTQSIVYRPGDDGRTVLQSDLSELLRTMTQVLS